MIGIHHRPGSFSDKWIEYCQKKNINYKLVDCYANNIIQQLADCKGLMWHWSHSDYKAINFARQLTYSLEHIGIKVFPSSNTCWHFDDKVGQKYLLEAIKAPFVNTYVFYDKKEAFEWAEATDYPKVFKLRGGAGSLNVKLVNNKSKAKALIKRAFEKGFSPSDNKEKVKDRWSKLRQKKDINAFYALMRGIALFLYPSLSIDHRLTSKQKGYVYFQDFISGNLFDIRIVVVGGRAFGLKRMVRKGSFKASGSGLTINNPKEIPKECVELSFMISNQLKMQCSVFDYVFFEAEPLLVEVSYGFVTKVYPGYWDNLLNWHEGSFTPEFFMLEDFLNEL